MVQGVRIADPTTATWNTPDAYAGDVHDPMSQKSFMYNNNNPFVYSDPSGYCAPVCAAVAAGAEVVVVVAVLAAAASKLAGDKEATDSANAVATSVQGAVNGAVSAAVSALSGALQRNTGRTGPAQQGRIEARDGTDCYYCHRPTTKPHDPKKGTTRVFDHKTPVSRGGGNGDNDKVTSCQDCNGQKGQQTEDEYRESHPNGSQTGNSGGGSGSTPH
jgi:5-methylcytosine-specific restriction endonuclease McrA